MTIQEDEQGLWAEQDKDSFLDYSLDWSDFLVAGDAIDTSTWSSDPGVTLNSSSSNGALTFIWVQGGVPGTWYAITNTVTTTSGRRDQRTLRIYIKDEAAASTNRTALFPNLAQTVDSMRQDKLMLAMQSVLPNVQLGGDYIAKKIKAAEADAERRLRVFFEPVTVFAYEPADSEIAALSGARYVEESAYDYEPDLWGVDDWGYLVLRKSPVIAVDSVVFAYPAPLQSVFTMPKEWIRLDKKAGHLRFVPAGSTLSIGAMSATILSAMSGGRTVPQMVQIKYRAGLQNAATEYPDLVDLVLKMAVLRVVQDAYLPQSGSISADGLSQSISVNMESYHDGVDSAIDTLLQALHGIRVMVL